MENRGTNSSSTITEIKKELTIVLRRLKVAPNMNGDITLRMSDGNVSSFEVKMIYK
jgi:hypothetical protein